MAKLINLKKLFKNDFPGHKGRPGLRGGSSPRSGSQPSKSGKGKGILYSRKTSSGEIIIKKDKNDLFSVYRREKGKESLIDKYENFSESKEFAREVSGMKEKIPEVAFDEISRRIALTAEVKLGRNLKDRPVNEWENEIIPWIGEYIETHYSVSEKQRSNLLESITKRLRK